SSDLQKQWRERVVRALFAAFPPDVPRVEFKNWNQCERLLVHAVACAIRTDVALTPEVKVRLATLLYRAGSYLSARGRYSGAEMLLSSVLEFYVQHFGFIHT